MSRHRNLKGLDYKEEYDDYYNSNLDDSFERGCSMVDEEDESEISDDDEIDDFEARYLKTGIDLNLNSPISKQGANAPATSAKCDKNIHCNQLKQDVDASKNNVLLQESSSSSARVTKSEESLLNNHAPSQDRSKQNSTEICTNINESLDGISCSLKLPDSQQHLVIENFSDTLSKMAVQHLAQHQWQLPLLEMDCIFRDRTYFKHYADSYLSNLQSKLSLFMDNIQPKMPDLRCHDNPYIKDEMLSSLVDYYRSLQVGFFSFSTPSPDEEIAIGCRFGSKAKPMQARKRDIQKGSDQDVNQQTRFEFSGTKANQNKNSNKSSSLGFSASNSAQVVSKQNIKKGSDVNVNSQTRFDIALARAKQNTSSSKSSPMWLPASSASSNQPNQKVRKDATADRQKVLETASRILDNSSSNKPTSSNAAPTVPLKRKTKKLPNEIENQSPSINLIVVGHVDAGKSTLIGHLLLKLGLVSSKLMHRYTTDSQRSGKASFKYAWILDETDEERSRGVTMDLASTRFKTQHRDINLIDAPGHRDFIPAVITGAAQADSAILVVDATRGEFETGFSNGGQTREHLLLIRSLGVKSLIVAVNKMDNVDWDEIRFNHVVDQLKPFIKAVGYKTEKIKFVPCSGLSGINLTTKLNQAKADLSHPQLEREWYDGPTLLECIDQIETPPRETDKPLRLCITDVFKGMSTGVFLGGSIEGGLVQEKQKLVLMPQNEVCEVKTIEMKEIKAKHALAGDSVTLVVTGIDLAKFYRGSILCDAMSPTTVTNRFQARIVTFDDIDTILLKGSPIEVHMNGMTESGKVRKLVSLLNKSTGDLIQKRPKCIAKNSSAIIEVTTSRILCVELYENYKNLGRFLVRSMGKTIAAGLVSKICRPRFEESNKKHRK